MKCNYPVTAVCYIILAAMFCRLVLSSGKADWLSVETPDRAYCGETFPVHVTLLNSRTGSFLSADLHWIDRSGVPRGYLSGSLPEVVAAGKKTYKFSIPVDRNGETASVFGVIVLSADGSWGAKTKAASLDTVPVVCEENSPRDHHMNRRTSMEIPVEIKDLNRESVTLRFIIAGIWFLTAVFAIFFRALFKSEWIAAWALICSIWEGLNCTPVAGDLLRNFSLYTGSYNYRHFPQQTVLFAVIFLISAFFLRLVLDRRKAVDVISGFCIVLFCGISLLGVISLHETDIIFSQTAAGLLAGQLARFTVSSMSLLVFIFGIISSRIGIRNCS